MNVLVTGASRGIGRDTALEFSRLGFNVAACALHSEKALNELGDQIKSRGCNFFGRLCDVSDSNTVNIFWKELLAQFGEIDVLVNNAGIASFGQLCNVSDEEWERVIDINLKGVFNMCRAAYNPMVKRKKGKIINISSVWGEVGASCEVVYSAAKGGVNSFTKALAKELAPSNIQVNGISVGLVDTQMNQSVASETLEELVDEIPMGRMGTSEDIAKAVVALAGAGKYITGQIIRVDGGWI